MPSHKPYCVLSNDYKFFCFFNFHVFKGALKDVAYAIAEFIKTNSAVVIPTNWFYDKKEKKYYWPEKSWNTFKRNKAI